MAPSVHPPFPPAPPAPSPPAVCDFDRLVYAIYKGPLEPRPWDTFLHLLMQRLRASHCVIMMRPAEPDRPSLMVVAGPTRTAVFDSYNEHFFKFDPFAGVVPHRIVVESDLMTDEEWLASAFYREYQQPEDVRWQMAVNLQPDESWTSYSLRAVRRHADPPFTEADKRVIAPLLPHLQQAAALRARMEGFNIERQLYAGTVERMQVGTVMLDKRGDVLSLNARAQAILHERDGIGLAGKTLRLDYAEEQQQFKAAVARVLAGGGGRARAPGFVGDADVVAITRPSGRPKLSALVRPVVADEYAEGWNRPHVAVFLRDPDTPSRGSAEVLRSLYDLTPAEARLALLMANGLSLEEAGDHLKITRNTVRAHLRAIFSKMGVTRQTELIRLVSNSVVDLV